MIKRKTKDERQTKFTVISSKDLFDPKNNPTIRLDAEFAIDLAEKLKKEKEKKQNVD